MKSSGKALLIVVAMVIAVYASETLASETPPMTWDLRDDCEQKCLTEHDCCIKSCNWMEPRAKSKCIKHCRSIMKECSRECDGQSVRDGATNVAPERNPCSESVGSADNSGNGDMRERVELRPEAAGQNSLIESLVGHDSISPPSSETASSSVGKPSSAESRIPTHVPFWALPDHAWATPALVTGGSSNDLPKKIVGHSPHPHRATTFRSPGRKLTSST